MTKLVLDTPFLLIHPLRISPTLIIDHTIPSSQTTLLGTQAQPTLLPLMPPPQRSYSFIFVDSKVPANPRAMGKKPKSCDAWRPGC